MMHEPKKQHFAAMAFIKNDENKILMQKRADPSPQWAYKKWEFPGGSVEWGESPEDALRREVKEEIGCEITDIQLIPIVTSSVRPDDEGSEYHVIILTYACRLAEGSVPTASNPEVGEIKWFFWRELKKLDSLPGTTEFLEQLADARNLR